MAPVAVRSREIPVTFFIVIKSEHKSVEASKRERVTNEQHHVM